MKLLYVLLVMALCCKTPVAYGQAQETTQLLLNIQKLSQLRKILQNMYSGYKILSDGYNSVKDIASGNFNVHKLFLDNLMKVNPAIKKYQRVVDITTYQLRIIREYKAAHQRFKSTGQFTLEEIEYMGRVYGRLLDKSLQHIDALVMVITASELRMTDDERIRAIDTIYEDIVDQLSFLRHFNNEASVLAFNRSVEQKEVDAVKALQKKPY